MYACEGRHRTHSIRGSCRVSRLLQQRLIRSLCHTTMVTMSQTVTNAKHELQKLCETISRYAEAHPAVKGSERLLKRAQCDLAFVHKLNERNKQLDFSEPQNNGAAGVDRCNLTVLQQNQLQGICNNIRGLQAEISVAQQAPDVISLGTRLYADVSAGILPAFYP